MSFVHRFESGRVAWSATLRHLVALAVPFWDGDAPGRAYTRREMRRSAARYRTEMRGLFGPARKGSDSPSLFVE